jgi:DNA polymerase (family 10)
MKNAEIADLFNRIADMLEILGEDAFRTISYRRAARALEGLPEDIEAVAARGELQEIDGVGKSTAARIQEYLDTGKMARYEELAAQAPAGLLDLMHLGGLGPKTAMKLWKEAGVASIDELKAALAADPGRILRIKGMGEKKLQAMRDSLESAAAAAGRTRLVDAEEAAAPLLAAVRAIPGVRRVEPAGSLRRGRETVGDIDLLCAAPQQDGQRIVDSFAAGRGVVRVLAKGPTKGSVLLPRNIQADLRVVPPESFGAALAYFTGSKDHNVHLRGLAQARGWKLNEYGLLEGQTRIAGEDEEGIYKALGLQFVPPELREDWGEVQAAAAGKLPALLEASDIRADLHTHTVASDGLNTIDEMIDAARARGYKALCISDHSKGQPQANGLDERRLAEHIGEIRAAAARHKDMLVLAGAEVDILKDGTLDYADDVLARLDVVVASCHSQLKMNRRESTDRLLRAMDNPHVNIIGHPSGRLVNGRSGMDIDVEALARAASQRGVALEINADPARLDLRDVHVRAAVAAGAKLAINSDAHSIGGLALMRYGVLVARRGWATAADVINTLPPRELEAFLRRRRGK